MWLKGFSKCSSVKSQDEEDYDTLEQVDDIRDVGNVLRHIDVQTPVGQEAEKFSQPSDTHHQEDLDKHQNGNLES